MHIYTYVLSSKRSIRYKYRKAYRNIIRNRHKLEIASSMFIIIRKLHNFDIFILLKNPTTMCLAKAKLNNIDETCKHNINSKNIDRIENIL